MNKKPYSIMNASEMEIDNLTSLPDYFFGIRVLEDETTGTSISTPVRVPSERLFPSGNATNEYPLTTNNNSLSLSDNQVLGGYIDTTTGVPVVRLADSTHSAKFLIVANFTEGRVLVQTTGFFTFDSLHGYIVGQQYYLGSNGAPVTSGSQKLFYVVDEYTISVNGAF